MVAVDWKGLEDWVDWWESFSKSLEAENLVSAPWEDESLMMTYGVGMGDVGVVSMCYRACKADTCGMLVARCG